MESQSDKVEFYISASLEKNLDILSKSDPYCVIKKFEGNSYVTVYETEVQKNNLSPEWMGSPQIPLSLQKDQRLKFEVYDYDKKGSSELMGQVERGILAVVDSGLVYMDLKSAEGETVGSLCLRAETVSKNQQTFSIQFKADNVEKKDTFGKSDPYLVLYKLSENGKWFKVHQTEVIQNTSKPLWNRFEISAQRLSNQIRDNPVKIECWDYDDSNSSDYIGQVIAKTSELSVIGNQFPIVNPEKQNKKKYSDSGTLEILDFVSSQEYFACQPVNLHSVCFYEFSLQRSFQVPIFIAYKTSFSLKAQTVQRVEPFVETITPPKQVPKKEPKKQTLQEETKEPVTKPPIPYMKKTPEDSKANSNLEISSKKEPRTASGICANCNCLIF